MSANGKHIIGLTGGIGSGKSTAAAYLSELGAHTLDADGISRSLLENDGGCYDAVVASFGKEICCADGSIDRKALAKTVFADAAARSCLNDIVHPAVCAALMKTAKDILAQDPGAVVILDVPLLFECGLYRETDANILICAEEGVRLARTAARDNATEAQVLARMRAQMPQEEKRALADVVIDNSGTLASLRAQLFDWYAQTVGEWETRT